MSFSTYLINLDTAEERLQRMDGQLQTLGLAYQRVSAVIGDELKMPVAGFDSRAYRIRTGKKPNLREIGCYFSHLKVMQQFIESDSPHALILEDDATLPDDFAQLLKTIITTCEDWDLLRLSSSRRGRFIDLKPLGDQHQLAINTRVLKNTAAYLINRTAATACIEGLQPMRQPFDVALDRDWRLGFRAACVVPFPVGHGDVTSQIPNTPRVQPWRSTTFHLFHIIDRLKRSLYRNRIARQILAKATRAKP